MAELGHSSAHRGIKTIPKLLARGPRGGVEWWALATGKGQITRRGRQTTRVGERARVTVAGRERRKEAGACESGDYKWQKYCEKRRG